MISGEKMWRAWRIRLPMASLMLLLLLLVLLQIYWVAVLEDGKEFSRGTLVLGSGIQHSLYRNYVLHSDTGYALLGRGDRLSIDAIVSGTSSWQYILTVVDLASGETYSYNATYYSSRAPTPLFIAPKSSLYYYNLTIVSLSNVSEWTINIKISGQQVARQDVIMRLPIATIIILFFSLIIGFLINSVEFKNNFIDLLSWEFRTL
ncbi:hypothetical protein Shell_0623 [Staphylothermus hellenicus DSM 12710]|uniref:Uncharacterized protein n=1 Tax=Staphylothermus hellenicus (strain DSM 12710 / JCM 10830 / BK20S6-10-b1 / P8) TaxID=591019 RepID=D7DC51_STAHD|nr:hypothetical protein Shell_0623 [Staphylothermus hellenicus DSM 12710]